VKRVEKNIEEQVLDKSWWGCQYRMSCTHVFLRCMHPNLEDASKYMWDRPDKDGRKGKRPNSLVQVLGELKWEKPFADWITATVVGLPVVGQEMREKESEKVERNAGWQRDPCV
jgi:hypothetical protein